MYEPLMRAGTDLPPGAQDDIEQSEWAKGGFDPTDAGCYFLTTRLFEAILRAAAAGVGVENVDGAAVYNVLGSGRFTWDPQRRMGVFGWEAGKRVGHHTARIFELRGGELIALTDPLEAPRIMEP